MDRQVVFQQVAKAYHANNWILEDWRVPIFQQFRYFDAVVSSVVRVAGGHRTRYQKYIQSLNLHFRKFCRSIVRLSPHIGSTLGWHELLHIWNKLAAHFAGDGKVPSRSGICCAYWKLAAHIAKLPIHHWIQKVFIWQTVGRRWLGRQHRWRCRYQRMGHCARLWVVGQHVNGMKEKCSTPHGVQAWLTH